LLHFTSWSQQIDSLKVEHFIKTQQENYNVIYENDKQNYPTKLLSIGNYLSAKKFRLDAKKTHSSKNSYGIEVRQRIQAYHIEYKDSLSCRKSVDSLLNCFPGDSCKIKRGQNSGCKVTNRFYIFNKTSVTIAIISCEAYNQNWKRFQIDLVNHFGSSNSELLDANCGPIKWTSLVALKSTVGN
jgi:hypothetical protein